MFMPVGTQASVKGLTSQQLEEINCPIILGNTFHLALRPGEDTLDRLGGIQKFMSWPKAVLTDSGGFQMVSIRWLLLLVVHISDRVRCLCWSFQS